jgi:hypothetical protein
MIAPNACQFRVFSEKGFGDAVVGSRGILLVGQDDSIIF